MNVFQRLNGVCFFFFIIIIILHFTSCLWNYARRGLYDLNSSLHKYTLFWLCTRSVIYMWYNRHVYYYLFFFFVFGIWHGSRLLWAKFNTFLAPDNSTITRFIFVGYLLDRKWAPKHLFFLWLTKWAKCIQCFFFLPVSEDSVIFGSLLTGG